VSRSGAGVCACRVSVCVSMCVCLRRNARLCARAFIAVRWCACAHGAFALISYYCSVKCLEHEECKGFQISRLWKNWYPMLLKHVLESDARCAQATVPLYNAPRPIRMLEVLCAAEEVHNLFLSIQLASECYAGDSNPEWLLFARSLPENFPFKLADAGMGSCVPLAGQHPARCALCAHSNCCEFNGARLSRLQKALGILVCAGWCIGT
jgi:hypothetical protein